MSDQTPDGRMIVAWLDRIVERIPGGVLRRYVRAQRRRYNDLHQQHQAEVAHLTASNRLLRQRVDLAEQLVRQLGFADHLVPKEKR